MGGRRGTQHRRGESGRGPRRKGSWWESPLGCLSGWVLLALAGTAVILPQVLLFEHVTGEYGPWLAALGPWRRAGVGVASALAAAVPLTLWLTRVHRYVKGLVALYAFTVWGFLSLAPLPGRYAETRLDAQLWREDAGWAIVTSILTFHACLVALFVYGVFVRGDDGKAPA